MIRRSSLSDIGEGEKNVEVKEKPHSPPAVRTLVKNTGIYGPDRAAEVSVGTYLVQRWREGRN